MRKGPKLPVWYIALCACICIPLYPCVVPWCLYNVSQFCRDNMWRLNPKRRRQRKAEAKRRAEERANDTPREIVVLGARPRDNGPAWLTKRERPITPPSPPTSTSPDPEQQAWKTVSQTCPFFTKFPPEIRRRIYDFALGDEMLRLEADGAQLDVWRCNGWTRNFWAHDGPWKRRDDVGWKVFNYPPEEHKKGRKKSEHKATINLLCTCRQVYLEAIASIYESQTFVLAIGPHEERMHQMDKPTLLYLPYFILPQRLNQLRALYIHWNLSPAQELHLGIAHETTFWWKECWNFLSTLQGLNELLIKFQCRDEQQSRWDWEPLEAQLGECVKGVKARKRFVVVLPFPESQLGNIKLEAGDERCEVRLPEKMRLPETRSGSPERREI